MIYSDSNHIYIITLHFHFPLLPGLLAWKSGSVEKAAEFQKKLVERDLSLELLPTSLQDAVTKLTLSSPAKDDSSAK